MVKKRELLVLSQLRKNSRVTLTKISKETGIAISSAFDMLKSFRASGLVQLSALVDFAKIGFGTRCLIAVKLDKDARSQFEDYLCKHLNVNTVQRVNNGFSFMIDAVFKEMRENEDFIEDLEAKFKVRKKMVFYVIGEVKREAFLSEPATAELMVFGNGKDE